MRTRRRRGSGFSATVFTRIGAVHVQAGNRTDLKRQVRQVCRQDRPPGTGQSLTLT